MTLSAAVRKRLIPIKDTIVASFTKENWLEIGIHTDCSDVIEHHPRLLRSLSFDDDDYAGCVLDVVQRIVNQDEGNIESIETYIGDRFARNGTSASSVDVETNRIVFSPSVFQVPNKSLEHDLVSVMMPFEQSLTDVHEAIKSACASSDLRCLRADDIWDHSTVIQDVFSLIFRSFIVVCDFSGRNPNVFYEAGIAHTLGKHVIPITQSIDDIPFDLRHHRFLRYLNNGEGLCELVGTLAQRLKTLSESDKPASWA